MSLSITSSRFRASSAPLNGTIGWAAACELFIRHGKSRSSRIEQPVARDNSWDVCHVHSNSNSENVVPTMSVGTFKSAISSPPAGLNAETQRRRGNEGYLGGLELSQRESLRPLCLCV